VTYLVLEHVEQRGLAGVVEAEEEDLRLLLPQPQRRQHPVEPVHQEHLRPPARLLDSRRAARFSSLPLSLGRRRRRRRRRAAAARRKVLTDLGGGGGRAAKEMMRTYARRCLRMTGEVGRLVGPA